MITFEEARRLVCEQIKRGREPGRIIELPLLESLGVVLVRPVSARSDSPRFDSSSVDGYAVSLSDFADRRTVSLPIVGTVHAGATSQRRLKPGTTQQILTGAPVPKGTDAIVMQEDVVLENHQVTFRESPKPGANIRKRGGELRRGEKLFDAGTVITPSVAQTLAACGFARVKVHSRPTVSIIITGDELRTPGLPLKHGQIWDSNATALIAALHALGVTDVYTQHVSDNPASTTRAIRAALARSDVVIATGGVSVGERDYVKEAFASNGVREIFWRVNIKPGKPIYFGTKRQSGKTKYVFGLPGNPVSVMVTYQLIVRQAILHMMGHAREDVTIRGILASQLKKSDSRTEFVRAYHEFTGVSLPKIVPLNARESHMTTGMAKADCLIVFPAEKGILDAGSEVEIIPIEWAAY